MTGPTVLSAGDAEAARELAATVLAEALERAARNGSARVRLALSGGGTPVGTYQRLGGLVPDWSRIDVFLADERCVPFKHRDSNARLIDEALGADRDYTLYRLPEVGTPVDRARAYAHDLGEDPLDVVLLGLGEDGHTASLFPGHPALAAAGVTVAVLDAPKPPPERVSLTLPALRAAGELVLLAVGAGKAQALKRALQAPGDDAPVSRLPPKRLTVIADRDALGAAQAAGLVPPT